LSFADDFLGKPETQVRSAWVTAIISGVLTMLPVGAGMLFNLSPSNPITQGLFLDLALTFTLAYGIFRRSRFAAIMMLCYWVAGRVYLVLVHGDTVNATWFLMAGIFALRVHGTFALHGEQKKIDGAETAPPAI